MDELITSFVHSVHKFSFDKNQVSKYFSATEKMEFKRVINLIIVFCVTNSLCYNQSIPMEHNNFLDTFNLPTGIPPTTDIQLTPPITTVWPNPPPTTELTPDDTTMDSEVPITYPVDNSEHQWFIVSMVFIPAAAISSSIVLFLMCTMKETVPSTGFIAPVISIPRV